jgi:hypothetical protein
MSQKPPLPRPEPSPAPITFDQYEAYTPEKLELWNGFYNYAMEDMTGFHLAVLRNMGLREAVRNVAIELWLEAIRERLADDLAASGHADEATIERLNRAISDLRAIADISNRAGENPER